MSDQEFKNTKEVELLKPKNDIVFQSLFNQNNERITKAFMQAILEEKIDKIVINNDKELFREFPEDKLGILDLQLDINNNEKIDVEIQLINNKNLPERLLLYFSKLYSSQIRRGTYYKKAKRIILVAIIDYDFSVTKNVANFETIWKLREDKNFEKILTDKIEIHIIELNKVRNNYIKNKGNEKLQWMLFLDNPNSKEVQEIMDENEEDEKLKRLAELRERAIMDEKAYYDTGWSEGMEDGRQQGFKEGREEGREEGIEKGIKQGRKEEIERLVKKMIKADIPKEQIAEIAEISLEEIGKIEQNINNKN